MVPEKSDLQKGRRNYLIFSLFKFINFELHYLFLAETQQDWETEGLEHKVLNVGSTGAACSALSKSCQNK